MGNRHRDGIKDEAYKIYKRKRIICVYITDYLHFFTVFLSFLRF